MVLDQRARMRPILAPFFGRPARCDRSAGVLMKRLRAPVLVIACTLTDDPYLYRIEFYDCLWPDELKAKGPVDIATRVNQAFERMILDYPDQYFWLHDRFKDTPESFSDDNAPSEAASGPTEKQDQAAVIHPHTNDSEREQKEAPKA